MNNDHETIIYREFDRPLSSTGLVVSLKHMNSRLLDILKLKASESRQVSDLLIVQFFIGVANAMINILAITLFIKQLSIDEIPIAYVVIAFSLLILNLVYENLEHRFSPLKLLKIIVIAYIAILLALWIGLKTWDKHTLIFILLVWSFLIYMITSYAFWGLVAQLFNVRESKRIFSVVGSGDMPAKLVGYMSAPLLIKLAGVENLIWFAILALAAGVIFFEKAIKQKRWEKIRNKTVHHHAHHETTHLRKKALVSFFFKNELIFAISILSLISYNVFNLVDFTFLAEVKNKFVNHAALSTFIAVFFALGRLVALVMKLIFTSRVIEKLGVISCLFITPLFLLVFSLLLLFADNTSSYTIYIFGLMAMFTEVLRSTMQEPVFFILFQPLKEQLRLKGHIISKGYMLPPSLLIVGGTLIVMRQYGMVITISLIVKILLVNLLIWGMVIYLLRKAYLDTLRDSIKKGFFSLEKGVLYDEKTISLLLDKVKNGKENEIIYSLSMLESADYPNLQHLLEAHLSHSSRDVRAFVLRVLGRQAVFNAALIRQFYDQEDDREIRQEAADLLCHHDDDFLQELSLMPAEMDVSIRKTVIINLLNHKEFKYLYAGGQALNSLIYSQNPDERELAVQIITELKTVRFTDAIKDLIDDPEPRIRKLALIAAGKLKIKANLPQIIRQLDKPAEKYPALQSLQHYGDDLFTYLNEEDTEAALKYPDVFIKLASKTNGRHSTNYLLAGLKREELSTGDIIHSLWAKGYSPESSPEIETLKNLRDRILSSGNEKVSHYYEVPDFKQQDIVRRSIDHEIKSDLVSALKICAILHNSPEYNRILELISLGDHAKLVNAIEMLELVLPKKIANEFNGLFNYLLDPSLSGRKTPPAETESFMEKILERDTYHYSPWTRAICMYLSWKNNQQTVLRKLAADNPVRDHYIVNETRKFILESTA